MTRSEQTGAAATRRENARLSRQVADLKRRIEELEQGPCAPVTNPVSRPSAPAAQDIHEPVIRQIIDLVPHSLFVKDIDGRFILVNQATATAYGLTVEEMTGRTMDEVYDHPALVARYHADDLEVIETGKAKHIAEEPFVDGRGRERWRQAIKIPYRTADSGKPAILCVSQDITEQKQALEALQESELRLSNHNTHTPVAVIVWGTDFRAKEWNPAAEKIFGYSADEAIGRHATELILPETDKENLDTLFQRILLHEGGEHSANANVTKDGRSVFIEWYNTPLRDAAGETIGVAALALDVTEQKRAAASLAQSENKYRSLFETSLDGILFTDTEGIIQEANPAFLQMLGYDIAELRGRSVDDISHPDWLERNRTIREKILVEPHGEYEKEYLHHDGSWVPVSIQAWPVGDGDGPPARFMGIIRDISERKAAETALAESQQLLRTVTDNVPAIISYLDENGCYRFVNKAYEDWYGRPRNEFIGMSVYELIDEESFNVWEPYFHRALTGEAVKFDIERDYPKFGRHTMEITYVPDVAADGHVRGLFGLGQDVTDRRAAEEALRKSEARLAEAQRITGIGSWERNIESGKEQWSDQYFRLLGHEPGAFEPSYADFLRHVHPGDRDRVKSENKNLAQDGRNYDTIFRIVRADGVERVVRSHGHLFRNEAFRPVRTAGTFRDITEQLQAEEALRKSEQNLRGIMENVADGVITIDERAIIQSFNQSAEKMFGYPAAEVIGRNVELLMPEPERSLHPGFVKRYLETGTEKLIGQGPREVLGQRKDGATFPMELAISEMLVGGRRTFIGTMRDASERKLIEEQLRQAQKMEAVGQLTGGVAHDFNNLLTVMLGNLELVREHLNGDADATRMIERAVQAAGRGAALTNRLLAFSRKQVLQPEAINLDALVSEMADMLVRTLGETVEVNTLAKDELWLDV